MVERVEEWLRAAQRESANVPLSPLLTAAEIACEQYQLIAEGQKREGRKPGSTEAMQVDPSRRPIVETFGVLNGDGHASAVGYSDQGKQRFGKHLNPKLDDVCLFVCLFGGSFVVGLGSIAWMG